MSRAFKNKSRAESQITNQPRQQVILRDLNSFLQINEIDIHTMQIYQIVY